ncbi:hypothetical protein [Bacillus sp. FJAT-47783]|uniref:hypothetical protein n=1 Tax=Bacillus sp. FJAT-47783 TaxID=2922712 RepID=UPI001FAE5B6C|nr:hypothetical protein [Bacillus sp. FJAT-47783]
MTIFVLSFIVIGYFVFIRNFPVLRLRNINMENLDLTTMNIVDIRDYNDAFKSPVHGAINVPVAYFNRYFSKIPQSDLVVVASNRLEKNIGIRFLRKKGFKVVGYTMINQ